MPETERIEFEDGAWWEIKKWLTRGDRRRIDEHVQRAALKSIQLLQEAGLTLEAVRSFAEARTAQNGATPGGDASNLDEEDMTLLCGTVAWSYPEPITMAALSGRKDTEAQAVLAKMRELYSRPEELQKNLSGTLLSGPPAMAA